MKCKSGVCSVATESVRTLVMGEFGLRIVALSLQPANVSLGELRHRLPAIRGCLSNFTLGQRGPKSVSVLSLCPLHQLQQCSRLLLSENLDGRRPVLDAEAGLP